MDYKVKLLFQESLNFEVCADEGLPNLCHMKSVYENFLQILAELHSMIGFDPFDSLQATLASLSGKATGVSFQLPMPPSEDQTPTENERRSQALDSESMDEQCFMNILADRIITDIIRDPRNCGVIFDQRQRHFIRKSSDTRPSKTVL